MLLGKRFCTAPALLGYDAGKGQTGFLMWNSFLWQMLAVLAVSGLILVLLFAIIEPGPLVKKRPFPRRQHQKRSGDDGSGSGP